ncbi:unnamed protein product [Pleuronectes platessa]|uniref:Uncharacterized protein n=1 Tax=Pleuronectes platessa TaxID=8262 RepID=A0A9N7UFD9_PLEPL|nr:unnamed protein product [Pleuronectes platessa]
MRSRNRASVTCSLNQGGIRKRQQGGEQLEKGNPVSPDRDAAHTGLSGPDLTGLMPSSRHAGGSTGFNTLLCHTSSGDEAIVEKVGADTTQSHVRQGGSRGPVAGALGFLISLRDLEGGGWWWGGPLMHHKDHMEEYCSRLPVNMVSAVVMCFWKLFGDQPSCPLSRSLRIQPSLSVPPLSASSSLSLKWLYSQLSTRVLHSCAHAHAESRYMGMNRGAAHTARADLESPRFPSTSPSPTPDQSCTSSKELPSSSREGKALSLTPDQCLCKLKAERGSQCCCLTASHIERGLLPSFPS